MHDYPRPICSKLPNVGATIFTIMSKLAADCNAINLLQGFADFDCAPELRALFTFALGIKGTAFEFIHGYGFKSTAATFSHAPFFSTPAPNILPPERSLCRCNSIDTNLQGADNTGCLDSLRC